MTGHRLAADRHAELFAKANYIEDPGDAGTFLVENKSGAICILRPAGTETRVLPDPENIPVGTSLMVMLAASQQVTISTVLGGSVIIAVAGETAKFQVVPTSASDADNAWKLMY